MESHKLGKDIHIVSNKINRKMSAAFSKFDITHIQFHIMLFINNAEGPIYQKDIETAFNLRRSTVSKILSLLEKKGFISKKPVPSDARLKQIDITQSGICQLHDVESTFSSVDNYLISNIDPDELIIFYKVLNKLSQLTD